MKQFLLFGGVMVLMMVGSARTQAQYVTIPDSNFVSWLHAHGYAGCMSGNQLDTNCTAVLNEQILVPEYASINNLEGIQYFKSLHILFCSLNNLTALPSALPPALQQLRCDHNQLSGLPSLPDSLKILDCSYNQITSLPSLPAGLKHLLCNYNHITYLPTLPSSLLELACGANLLTALPTLPNSLTDLGVSYNPLHALPVLPNGLLYLGCDDDSLVALPNLPQTLQDIYCEHNQLTQLPSLSSDLIMMFCSDNQLTSLPALPNTLGLLDCSHNLLTTLPPLPHGLVQLICSFNQLTSLPNLPDSLVSFFVNDNPALLCMPPLKKFIGSDGEFSIANTGIECLSHAIVHFNSNSVIDSLPLCAVINAHNCEAAWNVYGYAYLDSNGNCLHDQEPSIKNVKLNLYHNGLLVSQYYSNALGQYYISEPQDTYVFQIDTSVTPFLLTCSSNSDTVFLNSNTPFDTLQNLGMQCKPGFDLAVQSIFNPTLPFFPFHHTPINIAAGELAKYHGINCDTTGLSGTVTATFTGPAVVTNASGNGIVAGNTVTWNVSDFSQLSFFNDFSLTFLTDSFPPQGSRVCITVTIASNNGTDNNNFNNSLTQCFNVLNSFDPNYKEVYPTHVDSAGQWLTYTVHFQNTGTAPAQNILVIDTLDSNLDWSSFQLLAYSHDNLTQVLNNGIVHFNFPNIELPDSTTNEPLSHGWIQYKIKTKSTITPGTQVHNTASIYFDFNTPVITNDAAVNYCSPTSSSQTVQICQGDSALIAGSWQHQSGTFTAVINNVTGCDSTVTTNLVVHQPSLRNVDTTVCPGQSIAVGDSVYYSSGMHVLVLQNAQGCDSVITTLLNLYAVNTPAVTVDHAMLTAPGNEQSYQWYSCATNQPIAGATQQTFIAYTIGSYWVQVTDAHGCTASSQCISVTALSVAGVALQPFDVFPNPTRNDVTISYVFAPNTSIEITDLVGRKIKIVRLTANQTVINLNDVLPSAYNLRLMQNGKCIGTRTLAVMR